MFTNSSAVALRLTRCLVGLLVAWLLAAAPVGAQVPGETLTVSLLTFGPGEAVWERFGHNAIVIRDTRTGRGLSYNYGIFDFEETDFATNFLRGHMRYGMAVNDADDDIALYAEQGREVVEQPLRFTPAQRYALYEFLQWNAQPENAKYRYEYFTANCSTQVRDALDRALGGTIRGQLVAPSRGFTFRLHANRLMAPDPLLMLPMDLGLGPYADRPLSFWDESFVPMAFMKHLQTVTVSDESGAKVPLVEATRKLHAASPLLAQSEQALFARKGPWPLDYWLFCLPIGAGLGEILYGLAARRRSRPARVVFATVSALTLLAMGLGGLMLAGLWSLTEHVSAWRNGNLLLLNPLVLLLIPAYVRARRETWTIGPLTRWISRIVLISALAALGLKLLPWIGQHNGVWVALLLPMHLSLFLALRRLTQPADGTFPAPVPAQSP
ncbi:DUF4105 domain-containing protein [Tahibacter amnicola]|uniref:DUF4105 domain-containing protein n=1 Tax=Tahibacter amnicola TaxID=2976241 RepID=A0ABY6BIC6_9GAMM|nr:DUF4105 domain-containing protein [Tahibacter amnicola]UXI69758.1 DUF4105 domain-containing protein [Tahibacter amnicola]